jgi:hypothetical protein
VPPRLIKASAILIAAVSVLACLLNAVHGVKNDYLRKSRRQSLATASL